MIKGDNFRFVTRTEFKENISKYLKELEESGEFYVLVRGKPVAKVMPVRKEVKK
jgi:prevent-host-death family protein